MWMSPSERRLFLTARFTNYRELHQELEADGFEFKSSSDTEVLLNLYLPEMARRCFPALNGMFAFAIWDAFRNRLFLARAESAVARKPLHMLRPEGLSARE